MEMNILTFFGETLYKVLIWPSTPLALYTKKYLSGICRDWASISRFLGHLQGDYGVTVDSGL